MAFFGCEEQVQEQAQNWNDKGRIYKMVDVDSRKDFSIFCDRSTNIAYLRYWQSNSMNGFTVYYNSDGQPAHCGEVKR
jgi:hypothetical protein